MIDPWYDRHCALSARHEARLTSPGLGPEAALLEAEENARDEAARAVAHGRRTGQAIVDASNVRQWLARLPPLEAQAIALLAHGRSYRAIALVQRTAVSSVQTRVERGRERIRWLAGPGSLFSVADVHRDLKPALPHPVVVLAAKLWEVTSVRAVARILRRPRTTIEDQVLALTRRQLPELAYREPRYQVYSDGFSALRRTHRILSEVSP